MTIQILPIFILMFYFSVFAEVKPRYTLQKAKRIELLRQQEASRTPAQKCNKKDFSKQLGPVRTQGVGNCYAYQAADLLTHKLKLKPPEQVSATELSIRFSTFAKDITKLTESENRGIARILDLKNQSPQMRSLQESIYQKLKNITDEESNFFQKFRKANNNKKSIHDLMDFGGFGDITVNLVNEDDSVCISSHLDEFGEESDFIKELMAWMKLEIFAECKNANDLQNFKDLSLTNQSIHQLIVKKFCKNIKIKEPIKAREIQLETHYTDGSSKIDLQTSKQTIDQLLDQNQIAGINYYSNFMVKGRGNNKHAKHGSSIVGREFRDGQCWYMVRNSRGNSCDRYVTQIDPNGTKPDIDCKNGGEIWIREDQLLPNIFSLTYIE